MEWYYVLQIATKNVVRAETNALEFRPSNSSDVFYWILRLSRNVTRYSLFGRWIDAASAADLAHTFGQYFVFAVDVICWLGLFVIDLIVYRFEVDAYLIDQPMVRKKIAAASSANERNLMEMKSKNHYCWWNWHYTSIFLGIRIVKHINI